MPIWDAPSQLVNLDTLLSETCPTSEDPDNEGCYIYSFDTHCVRFTFRAKPEFRVVDDNGEYRYTVYRIKAWSSQDI